MTFLLILLFALRRTPNASLSRRRQLKADPDDAPEQLFPLSPSHPSISHAKITPPHPGACHHSFAGEIGGPNVEKRIGVRRRDDDLRRNTSLGAVLSGQRIGFLDLWAACERSTDRGRRNRRPIGSPPVVSFADQHPSEIECEGNKRDCADDVESPHYLLLASCSTISRPR